MTRNVFYTPQSFDKKTITLSTLLDTALATNILTFVASKREQAFTSGETTPKMSHFTITEREFSKIIKQGPTPTLSLDRTTFDIDTFFKKPIAMGILYNAEKLTTQLDEVAQIAHTI